MSNRSRRLKRVNVHVTEQFLEEIRSIAYTEGYTDVSDYMRNLIRKDFKQRGISTKIFF